MKEYSFRFNHSVEGDFIEALISDESSIDEITYKVLQSSPMADAVPFSRYEKNGDVVFTYNVSGYVALHYRLDTFYNSLNEYLNLGLGIMRPLMNVKDYLSDYHYFVYNPEYIFYSKNDNCIKFILLPSDEYRATDEEIVAFLKEVLKRPRVSGDTEAVGFQMEIFRLFDSDNVTLSGLYKLFNDEYKKKNGIKSDRIKREPISERRVSIENKPVNNIAANPSPATPVQKQAPVTPTPVQTAPAPVAAPQKEEPKELNAFDVFGDSKSKKQSDKTKEKKSGFLLFGGKKKEEDKKPEVSPEKKSAKKGFFKDNKKATEANEESASTPFVQPPVQSSEPPIVLKSSVSHEEDTDVTHLITDEQPVTSGPMLVLVEAPSKGAPERVSLNFSQNHISFGRIAKDTQPCDVRFPKEMKNIGRLHAWIERNSNGEYVLVDLGSANHTTLNGEILVPNEKKVLRDGDEIGFAQSKPVKYRVQL